MNWKARLKHAIPPAWLNATLLAFPFLYATPLVRWETNLVEDGGVEDLLDQLERAMPLEGDVLECGSSRCGGSVLMARALRARGRAKTIFACDSFAGFDRAELADERRTGRTDATDRDFTSTSLAYVRRKLAVLGMDGIVQPVPGYFQDTLPGLDRRWCFSLIDCDLEKSMTYCAEYAWPRTVPGGRIVFDDYTRERFAGARVAVDAFVERHREEIAEHGLLRRLYFVTRRG